MRLRTCLTSLLLASMAFVVNAATYYKSVDEHGNVQYSQTKPNASKIEHIKVNAYAPDNKSSYKRPSLNSNKKEADKPVDPNAAEEKPPEKKLTKAQKQKGCASARSNLATMSAKGQVRQRNAKGETRYLSDKEKQARIKQTQDLINKNCK